ncbi:MAG: hypothetical protein LBH55_02895, partial [Mycoplasmataceae bacterium]|nr:hypothetical protein [Mycoplasmataceae bacterium]
MELDREYGLYLEYDDISDKNLKKQFDGWNKILLEESSLVKDKDGWYYPKWFVHGKQEEVVTSLMCYALEMNKFHKY